MLHTQAEARQISASTPGKLPDPQWLWAEASFVHPEKFVLWEQPWTNRAIPAPLPDGS